MSKLTEDWYFSGDEQAFDPEGAIPLHSEETYDDESPIVNTTGAKKKKRLTEAEYRRKINRVTKNPLVLEILLGLYIHRRLTAEQIHRRCRHNVSLKTLRNNLLLLSKLHVINKQRISAIASTHKQFSTLHYSLTERGLRMLCENVIKVPYIEENPDMAKPHYLLSDLAVGRQGFHHFSLQEMVTQLLHHLDKKELHVQSCEWRRYPYIERAGDTEQVRYRPDWLVFAPKETFNEERIKGGDGLSPLHIPLLSRDSEDKETLTNLYEPLVNIECDAKTFRMEPLREKWRIYEQMIGTAGEVLAVFSTKEQTEAGKEGSVQQRLRNVRQSLLDVLETAMSSDIITVIQGDMDMVIEGLIAHLLTKDPMEPIKSLAENERAWKPSDIQKTKSQKAWPVSPDEMFEVKTAEGDQRYAFFRMPYVGLVNPIAKALQFQAFLKENDIDIRVGLIYPNADTMKRDVNFLSGLLWMNAEQTQHEQRLAIFERVVGRRGEVWVRV